MSNYNNEENYKNKKYNQNENDYKNINNNQNENNNKNINNNQNQKNVANASIQNDESIEDTTKYGETISSMFNWITLKEQKKRADELANMTKYDDKTQKK